MKTAKLIGTAFIVLAGLAAASPLYAHKAPQSPSGMTMPGGGMQDMMGMMGMMTMMQQMNTMMTLCTNMMQAGMPGTGGGHMPMPQPAPEAPKQGG